MSCATWPAPVSPTRTMLCPSAAKIGRTRSNTGSGPPTMMTSVASRAPTSPPLTGASSASTPRAARRAAMRRVASGEVLRSLLERRLVKIVGRAEELGRPMLYGTTREFLKVFGLAAIEDLPNVKGLAPGSAPQANRPMTPVNENESASTSPAEPQSADSGEGETPAAE